jgi:hypothetical protein
MGLTAYSKTVLGVAVTHADFFMVTGHHRECSRCHKPQGYEAQYCAKCGGGVVTVDDETPTPQFAAYAAQWGHEPRQLYADLREDSGQPGVVGLLQTDALQTCEDGGGHSRRPAPTYALGVLLGRISSEGGTKGVTSLPVEQLQLPTKTVRQAADELGLTERPVQLFTCIYLSY